MTHFFGNCSPGKGSLILLKLLHLETNQDKTHSDTSQKRKFLPDSQAQGTDGYFGHQQIRTNLDSYLILFCQKGKPLNSNKKGTKGVYVRVSTALFGLLAVTLFYCWHAILLETSFNIRMVSYLPLRVDFDFHLWQEAEP